MTGIASGRPFGRRNVIRGAVWAAPVVLAAGGAPAFAASTDPLTFSTRASYEGNMYGARQDNSEGNVFLNLLISIPSGRCVVDPTITIQFSGNSYGEHAARADGIGHYPNAVRAVAPVTAATVVSGQVSDGPPGPCATAASCWNLHGDGLWSVTASQPFCGATTCSSTRFRKWEFKRTGTFCGTTVPFYYHLQGVADQGRIANTKEIHLTDSSGTLDKYFDIRTDNIPTPSGATSTIIA